MYIHQTEETNTLSEVSTSDCGGLLAVHFKTLLLDLMS